MILNAVSFEASIAQNCTLSGKVVDKETAESPEGNKNEEKGLRRKYILI